MLARCRTWLFCLSLTWSAGKLLLAVVTAFEGPVGWQVAVGLDQSVRACNRQHLRGAGGRGGVHAPARGEHRALSGKVEGGVSGGSAGQCLVASSDGQPFFGGQCLSKVAATGASSSATKRSPDGQCLSRGSNGGVGLVSACAEGDGQCLSTSGVRGAASTGPIASVTVPVSSQGKLESLPTWSSYRAWTKHFSRKAMIG